MGQDDIIKVMKKYRKWWSSDQLAKFMQTSRSKIPKQCNTLVRYDFLEMKVRQSGLLRKFYWRYKE